MAPRPRRSPVTHAPAAARPSLVGVVLGAVVVAAATLFVYRNLYGHAFLDYDDATYVRENALVLGRQWAALVRAVVSHNFHPLTLWSLAANVTTPLAPAPFLVTNVVLHVIDALLAGALAWQLSGKRWLVATWVGLLFGVHPMHVESVAWIAERKDVLYALWFLGAAILYTAYLQRRRGTLLGAAFVSFVLACLSKGMAVSFPLVMIAIDVWMRRPVLERRAIVEKLPFFAVAALFGAIAVNVQAGGDLGGLLRVTGPGGPVVRTLPHSLLGRVTLPTYGYMMYVWKLFVPARLCALDPFPLPAEVGRLQYLIAPLFMLGTFALAVWDARRSRVLTFAVGWYFATVAFVLQWLPVGQAIMADRYTYLPYVGLAFAWGMGLAWLLERRRAWGIAVACASVAFAAFLVTRASAQVDTWRDGGTLWSRVIEVHPDASQAYVARGGFFLDRGQIEPARQDYERALALGNRTAPLYTGLGVIEAMQGRPDSALVMFDRSLERSPAVGRTHYDRALVLVALDRKDEALKELDAALALSPGLAPTILATRGTLRAQTGDYRAATTDLDRAIAAGIAAPQVFQARALARLELGDSIGARADIAEAVQRAGSNAQLLESIRTLEQRLGVAPR